MFVSAKKQKVSQPSAERENLQKSKIVAKFQWKFKSLRFCFSLVKSTPITPFYSTASPPPIFKLVNFIYSNLIF
jgi:hypothetical protein